MRLRILLLLASGALASARAQSPADTLQEPESPAVGHITAGLSAGMMHFGSGGRERALSATVGISLPYGFSLGVTPTYAAAQAAPSVDPVTGRHITARQVQGLADLPVGVSYSHSLPGSWSPGFWIGLGAVLPTGDTTQVGSGETSAGADLSVWAEPGAGFSVSAGAGHSLTAGWASGLGSIAPTTVSLGLSHALGRASLSATYSTEVGAMTAGTTHSHTLAGGASLPLSGDFGVAINGSLGRADAASSWALSLGIGTAFADVATVSPANAASALAKALGHGRSLGKSRSTAAKTAAAARTSTKGKKK